MKIWTVHHWATPISPFPFSLPRSPFFSLSLSLFPPFFFLFSLNYIREFSESICHSVFKKKEQTFDHSLPSEELQTLTCSKRKGFDPTITSLMSNQSPNFEPSSILPASLFLWLGQEHREKKCLVVTRLPSILPPYKWVKTIVLV